MSQRVRIATTSRSQIETAEHCLRKRWYEFHCDGVGIVRNDVVLARELGTAIHCGIEAVATDECDPLVGVLKATSYLGTPAFDDVAGVDEALWLAEALVRAWYRVRWPEVVAEFEVLAVEQELHCDFPEGVRLLTRPDFVLRRRVDGALFILNLKTVSDANPTWREQWNYDMQTLTEPLAVEAHYGERCHGVMIEGIVKGRRQEYPEGSGNWYHNNPLTQLWYLSGDPPLSKDSFKSLRDYAWVDADGKGHRLPKGYRKRPVAEVYPGGIAAWVAQLPVDVVRDSFVTLPAILRSDWHIEQWRQQVLPREKLIADCASEVLATADEGLRQRYLNEWFPMSSAHGNCLRPGRCAYAECCWQSAAADPYAAGYVTRVPNHPGELVQIDEA